MTQIARCLLAVSAFAPFASHGVLLTHPTEDAETTPVVEYLFFNASWCGPCGQMRPTIERLNERGYNFLVVDVDTQRDTVDQYGVTGIPSIVAVADGRAIDRRVGLQGEEDLKQFVFQASRSIRESGAVQASDDMEPKPEIPGAVKIESLLRVTYDVPEAKAKALVAFLEEHSAAEIDADIEDDALRVTAAPEVHRALGPFMQTLLKR